MNNNYKHKWNNCCLLWSSWSIQVLNYSSEFKLFWSCGVIFRVRVVLKNDFCQWQWPMFQLSRSFVRVKWGIVCQLNVISTNWLVRFMVILLAVKFSCDCWRSTVTSVTPRFKPSYLLWDKYELSKQIVNLHAFHYSQGGRWAGGGTTDSKW